MVTIEGWKLALLLVGTLTVGMIMGWFVLGLCAAARAGDRLVRRHWMETE